MEEMIWEGCRWSLYLRWRRVTMGKLRLDGRNFRGRMRGNVRGVGILNTSWDVEFPVTIRGWNECRIIGNSVVDGWSCLRKWIVRW